MKRKTLMLELFAALSLTFAQILMTLAVIFLVLSSYEWWGSPNTPLAGLWKTAIVLFVIQWLLRVLHRYSLQSIVTYEPEAVSEVAAWSSFSQVSVPKLDFDSEMENQSEEDKKKIHD